MSRDYPGRQMCQGTIHRGKYAKGLFREVNVSRDYPVRQMYQGTIQGGKCVKGLSREANVSRDYLGR